jgi:hypothetical protein
MPSCSSCEKRFSVAKIFDFSLQREINQELGSSVRTASGCNTEIGRNCQTRPSRSNFLFEGPVSQCHSELKARNLSSSELKSKISRLLEMTSVGHWQRYEIASRVRKDSRVVKEQRVFERILN